MEGALGDKVVNPSAPGEGRIELERGREYATDMSLFDQLVMGTYSVPRLDSIKGG